MPIWRAMSMWLLIQRWRKACAVGGVVEGGWWVHMWMRVRVQVCHPSPVPRRLLQLAGATKNKPT